MTTNFWKKRIRPVIIAPLLCASVGFAQRDTIKGQAPQVAALQTQAIAPLVFVSNYTGRVFENSSLFSGGIGGSWNCNESGTASDRGITVAESTTANSVTISTKTVTDSSYRTLQGQIDVAVYALVSANATVHLDVTWNGSASLFSSGSPLLTMSAGASGLGSVSATQDNQNPPSVDLTHSYDLLASTQALTCNGRTYRFVTSFALDSAVHLNWASSPNRGGQAFSVLTVNGQAATCIPAAGRLQEVVIPLTGTAGVSCPVAGQIIYEHADRNGDGIPDDKVVPDYGPDPLGNKIEVWCLNDGGVPPGAGSYFEMFFTRQDGSSLWVGQCPFCSGFNSPISIVLGVTSDTAQSCILGTRWVSTEGGNLINPSTNTMYGLDGFDCDHDGIKRRREFLFDSRTNTRTINDYHLSKPTFVSQTVQAVQPTDLLPTSGIGPMSAGGVVLADLNADGVVDAQDFAIIQAAFGSVLGQVLYDPRADLDANGRVDFVDYQIWYQLYTESKTSAQTKQ